MTTRCPNLRKHEWDSLQRFADLGPTVVTRGYGQTLRRLAKRGLVDWLRREDGTPVAYTVTLTDAGRDALVLRREQSR